MIINSNDLEFIYAEKQKDMIGNINYLVYHQLNSHDNTSKYIIKEYNNDECSIEFYFNPDDLRIYGAQSSLMTYVQLSIEKLLNESKE